MSEEPSKLSAGAKEWKPNVAAAAWTPSWLPPAAAAPAAPAAAAPAAPAAAPPSEAAPATQAPPAAPAAAAAGEEEAAPAEQSGATQDQVAQDPQDSLAEELESLSIGQGSAAASAAKSGTPQAAAAAEAPAESPAPVKKGVDLAGFEKEKVIQLSKLDSCDKRDHLNVVFIGHVDAGKSTLSGSILFEMGTVDKRTIEKFEQEAKDRGRESWFLAYIMDTNDEERAKGKTVEVGRAYFETSMKRCTILDAPGHKNYVPAMISGASQADVGILVISARKGEFEAGFEGMGQTREHAMLAKTLGVQKLIVVINKMDDPTVKWDKDRYDNCVKKLSPFLKTCGYNLKKDVIFMPIAALHGINVKSPIKKETSAWAAEINQNRSIIQTLDELVIVGRDADKPLRMTVIDRYQDRGTVIMGKVESGVAYVGQVIMICPNQTEVKIDSIMANEVEIEAAKPGENVLVRCNIPEDLVQKGYVVTSRFSPVSGCTEIIGQVYIVGLLEHRPLMSAGYNAVFHAHTAEEECTVYELAAELDPKTGGIAKKNPAWAKVGATVIAKIRLNMSISLEAFEKTMQLGRFTLRDEGKTIAIGKIVKCR